MDLSDRIQALERRVDALETIKATPPVNGNRVERGGSFWHLSRFCRSAPRYWREPECRDKCQGFRPVAEVKGVPADGGGFPLRGNGWFIDASGRRFPAIWGWHISPEETHRAMRGSSIWFGAGLCRSAFRDWNKPESRSVGGGFRPVAEAKEMEGEARRVCRSTGWRWSSKGCRPAGRGAIKPEDRGVCLGFRPVAEEKREK